ncbi:hypothetical protein CE91St49_26130 [Emergencia timonensis]|uniref:Uncharacterized protein n=1 Tax=Emergencia timonensis TaxID=1776384 RepID=A0A415E7J6_9FIRM|nr:hypothetical protein [Emergencia timonensis]RHJ89772.1 hypothetical protein DW099_04190 [Emergencia timonensis]BDF09179.1 hypothetical protein CE91St48_26200 [Emergencia timonensis]BDF13266.1 hypothetical protein CE91St49_26130 [Emergencia timonensis]
MSDDKKTEKKIASYGKNIKVWLDEIERNQKKLQAEENEKKQEKLKKKIENNKESLKKTVEWLVEEGGNPKDFLKDITELHSQVIKDMFPSGADSDTVAIEKEIQRIKKMLNEDLKEAMEKYSYDPEEPIETRYKNKLFKAETTVGRWMLNAGNESLKDSMYYRECWNYDRDYEKTKDQYFTKEEQGLIEKCIQSRLEERDFLRQKNAFMYNLGLSIQKTAVKIGEWGDITSARVLAQGLSKEIFQQTVTEIEGKLPKDELKKRADEMTRRYIQFISDPHELEEAMIQKKESEIEADKLLAELRSSTEGAKMLLSGRERRQVEQWMEIAESEVEGQNILAYELLCEKLGKERAKFILLCKADPDLEKRKEALTSYSFEELGL